MPKFNEFLFGSKDKIKQAKTLNPGQEDLMKLITDALKSGKGPLSELFGGFDQKAFDEGVTNPALKNFQDKILPQLQEKFIAGNQVLGSGMRRAQVGAVTDLQSQLASLMYQAQQQQKQNQIAGLQTSLGTKTHENIYKQGQQGAVQGFVQGAGQGIGQAAGTAIAG